LQNSNQLISVAT